MLTECDAMQIMAGIAVLASCSYIAWYLAEYFMEK